MTTITHLIGREILDSRGRPTVKATCELASGAVAAASVPSGASTGAAETLELRDGDARRYRGLGCRTAAGHIGGEIEWALAGRRFDSQADLDRALVALDGTPNKAPLGANALLAVSLAFARAVAVERGVPLYRHFADILDERRKTEDENSSLISDTSAIIDHMASSTVLRPPSVGPKQLPRLTVNLFSGGKHAGGQVPIQD